MESFDVVKDISPGFRSCAVDPSIHPFAFQQTEETFHRCVVGTATHGAHAADQVVTVEEALVFGVVGRGARTAEDADGRTDISHRAEPLDELRLDAQDPPRIGVHPVARVP